MNPFSSSTLIFYALCFSGKASLAWARKCQQHDVSLPRRGSTVLDHRKICLTRALANVFRSPSSTAKSQAGRLFSPETCETASRHAGQDAGQDAVPSCCRGQLHSQGQGAGSHFPPASLFTTGCFVWSTPALPHRTAASGAEEGGKPQARGEQGPSCGVGQTLQTTPNSAAQGLGASVREEKPGMKTEEKN